MKKNISSKSVFILLMAGMLTLSGCNIHMSAEERSGIKDKTVSVEETDTELYRDISEKEGKTTISQKENETAELPIIEVAYEPYDLYQLAEWAFDLEKKEVDANLSGYGDLWLTPEDEDFPLGNTGISVFTDGVGMSIRWEDGAANYASVVANALIDIIDKYNSDYSIEPSHLVQAFPATEENSKLVEEAAKKIEDQLRQIGLSPSQWYGVVADQEFWDQYFESHYRRKGFEPEEDIYIFIFKQKIQGNLIENISGESSIYVVYSSEREKILLLDSHTLVYGKLISEEKKTLISEKDARILGADILKKEYGIEPVLTTLQLVYFKYRGGIDYEKQTATLYPAWKVNFQIPVGEQTVEDYILLNAENGIQITANSQRY